MPFRALCRSHGDRQMSDDSADTPLQAGQPQPSAATYSLDDIDKLITTLMGLAGTVPLMSEEAAAQRHGNQLIKGGKHQ